MDPPPAACTSITPVETRTDGVPGVEGSEALARTSPGELLGFARSWWLVAAHRAALHTALPGAYFDELGVPWLTPC